MDTEAYLNFCRPFIEALKEVFKVMMSTEIQVQNPKLKKDNKARGEITALIGMTGTVTKDGNEHSFDGLIALSFEKQVYLKVASAMLMEEFEDYREDMEDTGCEIANIVMGNAKKVLTPQGYKIGMATPTRIKGQDHEIKYPNNTIVIESIITSSLGNFTFDICYRQR